MKTIHVFVFELKQVEGFHIVVEGAVRAVKAVLDPSSNDLPTEVIFLDLINRILGERVNVKVECLRVARKLRVLHTWASMLTKSICETSLNPHTPENPTA